MSRHAKTERLIATAVEVLQAHRPMTVRQVYYQLVSRQVIENNRSAYQSVSKALISARQEGIIPWEWIEDRLRRPRHVSMWKGLADFGSSILSAYRRDVWATQSGYFETWLEKDALSGIFEDVLEPYGVTLNVGRGYDGWSSLHQAAERYGDHRGVDIIYFGDFDPSGEDMVRSLHERLRWFGCHVNITKAALTRDDIDRYSLPPDLTKEKDTRSAKFVERHGDISVELDALPVDVLRQRIIDQVESRIDLDALAACRTVEDDEIEQLRRSLTGLAPR